MIKQNLKLLKYALKNKIVPTEGFFNKRSLKKRRGVK